MNAEERIKLDQSLALDRRIASGEVSYQEGIELLVASGAPRGMAARIASILTGRLRDETLPDPKTLPGGSGL